MSSNRSFPPGLGWVGWVAALAVALLVSVFAAYPRYSAPQYVSSESDGPAASDPATQAGGQGTGANGRGPTSSGNDGHGGASAGTGSRSGSGTQAGPSGTKKVECAAGRNGGATAPGVTATEIHVASTVVTSGVGAGFLGEAGDGMRAAIAEVNREGGVCGRRITLETVNTGWSQDVGRQNISNFINSGKVFALVGEPDSEGLAGAIDSGLISRSGMPVVGSDGMLADQYFDPWVFPVAASTVTNMHIIADYAYKKLGARSFGIVYDIKYKFGKEGAVAFNNEIRRLSGKDIPGFGVSQGCTGANKAFCGISSDRQDYTNEINAFNNACSPCDAVVMLLEPTPMLTWMKGEEGADAWYKHLFGGEPLFDTKVAQNCPGCGEGKMIVWTGYHPAIQPFDAEPAVARYCQSLKAVAPKDDCQNEFTQGAYLGTKLFIAAVQEVGKRGQPLTRQNLRAVLESTTFDLGLASAPLKFGTALPRLANTAMAAFQDNYAGSFNGWSYLNTGFVRDPHPGTDLHR